MEEHRTDNAKDVLKTKDKVLRRWLTGKVLADADGLSSNPQSSPKNRSDSSSVISAPTGMGDGKNPQKLMD